MDLIEFVVSGKAVDKPGLKEALADALLSGLPMRASVTTEEIDGYTLALDAARRGASRIIAVGGDGTVHEVLAAILAFEGPRPEMGVVPAGTANDFASLLGPLADPFKVWVDRAVHEPAVLIDAGAANGVPFANMVTIGPAAQVSDETSKGLKRLLGKAAYVVSAVGAVGRVETIEVSVSGPDGPIYAGKAAAVCVANGRQVGGGLKVSADADLHDGLLDVLVVPEMSLAALGIVAGSAFLGQIDTMQGIVRARVPWVSVRSPGAFACSLDGEVAEVEELRCEAVSGAVALAGFVG